MDGKETSGDNPFFRENQHVTSDELLKALALARPVRLVRCTVTGGVDLNRLFREEDGFDPIRLGVRHEGETITVTLPQSIVVQSCTFENEVFFAPPWESNGTLKVIFENDVTFNSSTFGGQTRFSEAIFKGLAGFDGCMFQRVTSFTDAVFEGRTDFSGVYAQGKAVPVITGVVFARRRYGDEESFWRFIKQASQEAGYYQNAGECFYQESCARFWQNFRGADYDHLSGRRKVLRWLAGGRLLPELIFGRWLFGYVERPIRVLVAAVLVILLCALFYSSDYANVTYRTNPDYYDFDYIDGLYFSTVTFTTLGLGDVYPAAGHGITRIIAGLEAITGAFLMALFVVCLSKRYSRG